MTEGGGVVEGGVPSPEPRNEIVREDLRERKERAIIRVLLNKKRYKILKTRLERMRPADIADYLTRYSVQDQKMILSAVDDAHATEIIRELDPEDAFEVLTLLGPERSVRILDEMPADEKVDILGEYPEEDVDRILGMMDHEDREETRELLRFDEESAGGLMTTEVLHFGPDLTCAELITAIRRHREELETANYIFVTDEERHLVGVVTLRHLIITEPETIVGEIMERDMITVSLEDDQEEVAAIVSKYDLLAVPVVDEEGHLRGVVTVDDVIDVIEEEATEDMYRMVGLDEEEEITDSAVWSAVRRLPWLAFTLVGSICSGSIVSLFGATITRFMSLLVFMPAIMGMGGNTGLQSSTIVVRGLATGEIERGVILRVAFREVRVAILLGLVVGTTIAAICFLWQGNPMFGAIVGISMMVQITVAVVIGMIIPLALDTVGLDPAIAAGPIVTMISDINGLFIYFGIATLLLAYLV